MPSTTKSNVAFAAPLKSIPPPMTAPPDVTAPWPSLTTWMYWSGPVALVTNSKPLPEPSCAVTIPPPYAASNFA